MHVAAGAAGAVAVGIGEVAQRDSVQRQHAASPQQARAVDDDINVRLSVDGWMDGWVSWSGLGGVGTRHGGQNAVSWGAENTVRCQSHGVAKQSGGGDGGSGWSWWDHVFRLP